MKKIIFMISLLCLLFVGCRGIDDGMVSITFYNKTSQSISVESISSCKSGLFPYEILANSAKTFPSIARPESYGFTVKASDQIYKGNTGYVQDYSSFELDFTEESGQLNCVLKNEDRKIDLTKVDD